MLFEKKKKKTDDKHEAIESATKEHLVEIDEPSAVTVDLSQLPTQTSVNNDADVEETTEDASMIIDTSENAPETSDALGADDGSNQIANDDVDTDSMKINDGSGIETADVDDTVNPAVHTSDAINSRNIEVSGLNEASAGAVLDTDSPGESGEPQLVVQTGIDRNFVELRTAQLDSETRRNTETSEEGAIQEEIEAGGHVHSESVSADDAMDTSGMEFLKQECIY